MDEYLHKFIKFFFETFQNKPAHLSGIDTDRLLNKNIHSEKKKLYRDCMNIIFERDMIIHSVWEEKI